MGARAAVSAPRPLTAPVLLALIGQTLISAFTYLAAKRLLVELGPLTLVLLRLLLSAVVFAVVLAATPGPFLPPRREWRRVLILGLFAGPMNQGFFIYGLDHSTPAHAALLYALTPIGVYLLSVARKREPAARQKSIGIAVAFTGVAVLLLGRGLAAATGPLMGDLFILLAVAAWVLYTTEGKELSEEHGPIRSTAWTMSAGALWAAPFTPWLVRGSELRALTPMAWACLVFLVLFTSVVSYLLWYYALSRTEASRVVVVSNLQPVATALAAWVFLGEALVWEIWVGGALVLLGVRATQRP